jgi:uncharacterized Zn finger protein (UPF0148 family)
MARACEDCGTLLLRQSGTCPMCDEELLIFEQDSDYPFSDEFMSKVEDQEIARDSRK